jgi:hypothetical protein
MGGAELSTELQDNSLGHLRRTLSDLADAARQRRYKQAVPFVHVPSELLEQWAGHARLLNEQEWFRGCFSNDQIAALTKFDVLVASTKAHLAQNIDDVPAILQRRPWRELMESAGALLVFMPAPERQADGEGSA